MSRNKRKRIPPAQPTRQAVTVMAPQVEQPEIEVEVSTPV